MKCLECRYSHKGFDWECRRYPQVVKVDAAYWCGEFVTLLPAKVVAEITEIPVEAKRRGRPKRS